MSAIAAYAVEAETAKELKKGQFKLYHQKTPPTNVVLLDIHETDTDEVKNIKRLINQMRQELGNSTDLIKIEPETALFNILYTKKEVDQLIVSTGAGFNLPMFLNSVLIAGAIMIKLRSDGERVTVERYQEFAENTLDNFDYVARKFNEYAEKFKELNAQINDHDDAIAELTGELYNTNQNVANLTERVDVLEDTVSHIDSCQCDKKWMRFMKQNFQEGEDDEEIEVKGNLNLNGNAISGLTEMTTHGGVLNINGSLYVPNHPVTARNLPAELTFRHNGLKQNDYITDDGVVDYNTYGKWFQPCDIEAFGSIDVDNRLRINTLNNDKTKITKTVDVGASLEDLEYRIEQIESGGGGGGGDGFWKINPTHMQSLPEHPALETYDFTTKASTVEVRNIDNDTIYVYFPDLSVDLSYDRAQFIEIKSTNPSRTYYISTKNNQMEFPMITDYQTLQEEMVYKSDLNHIGMLWKRQIIDKSTTEDGKIELVPLFYTVYWSKYESIEEIYLTGSPERPLRITIDEYNSSKQKYRTSTFTLTTELKEDMSINGTVEGSNEQVQLSCRIGTSLGGHDIVYYITGVDYSSTFSSKWIFTEYDHEITVDEIINRIHNHTITFTYTPDRDKIINNEPISITSTEWVKNETSITAPNTFDLHKYGGVKDYEIRLDKLVIDDKSIASYNKISFKDFQIGGDYVGPIFTIYFGTTRFMMNNEQILTPISCYLDENGKYTTDQLLKKDGYWTTERVETDMPCFLWSKTAPITLQEAYNIGEITIKYIPRKSTLSADHDVICREVVADNALDLYRSSAPNFYNPKIITETTHDQMTYYTIDFGYSTDSDEFKQLPEGFRFRFTDPVFSYNYEAVKESNDWKFKYGNLHPNVNTSRFATDDPLWFGNWYDTKVPTGPCIIMNNSNEIALTYLVKHCLGHNVSGWDNMWKALWTDSRAKITTTGPLELKPSEIHTTKKVEGKNQYCCVTVSVPSSFKPELEKYYECCFQLQITTESVDVNLKFEYRYIYTRDEALEESIQKLEKVYDCYEVLNFSQHSELTFEYDERGKGLRFYASPDFLLWKTDINYEKDTNIFRFLYDRDYVQIEPRPESCSALMTDKNIITDGIIVAQNLETHLHSLNQVANVTEETIQRMQYTDAVLGEIIGNLASLNEFVRLTIMADFMCLGFTGLMGIVKFGEGVMKNGLRATLRLDEMPIISTAVRDGSRYTRIGESVTDMVQDARSMELVARDTLREEAQAINRVARDITEEAETVTRNVSRDITDAGENITQTARETIHQQAREVEVSAVRHQTQVEEDFSIFAGEISGEASEMDLYVESNLSIRAGEINNRTGRTTFGELLDENTSLLAVDGDRVAMTGMYARAAGDYIMGLFNRASGAIKNGCGIVFNSANVASLLENIWWVLDTYKDAIGWSVQFGANVYKLIEARKLDNGIDIFFTPDRFTWSVVDAEGIRTDHTITGIAKYNEMSGWDDQKLITGQALLENYYSKADIDKMLAKNDNSNNIRSVSWNIDTIDVNNLEHSAPGITDSTKSEATLLYCWHGDNSSYSFRYLIQPNWDIVPQVETTMVKFIYKDHTRELPAMTYNWISEDELEWFAYEEGASMYLIYNISDPVLSIELSWETTDTVTGGTIDPSVLDNYALKEHTHTSFDNLNLQTSLMVGDTVSSWKLEARTGGVVSNGPSTFNDNVAVNGALTTTSLGIGGFGIKPQGETWVSLKMNDSDWLGMNSQTGNMSVYKNLAVAENLNADKDVSIKGTLTVNGELTVNAPLSIKFTNNTNGFYVLKSDLATDKTTAIAIGKGTGGHECGSLTFKNSETPECGLGFWGHDLIISCKCKSGQATPNIYLRGNVNIDGELTANNIVRANSVSTSGITVNGKIILDGRLRFKGYDYGGTYFYSELYYCKEQNKNGIYVYDSGYDKEYCLWNALGQSETITHTTNVFGLGASSSNFGEIGTFCESNGKIYDGYEKIGETDCICQVKQSKSLNKKIVGIITSETQFASHGDVLVRVNDVSDCSVGDILVPDENGYGKVASEQDLMFMMLHAIPRPKITSLNTGIDGMVACFIV